MTDAFAERVQRLWELPDDPEGAWGARRRMAAALRALADDCVRAVDDEAAIAEVAAALEGLQGRLAHGEGASRAFTGGSYFDDPRVYIDRQALMGRCNPIAPPLVAAVVDGGSVCVTTLPEVYTGAPGMVHGGVIAAIFDQVCGHAMITAGVQGFTVALDVRYRRPTRIGVPLTWRARAHDTGERLVAVEATCSDDREVTATASARFARMDPERAQAVIRSAGEG